MGFLSGLIGVVEGVTGIDVPFIGPGDRFFAGERPGPGSVAGTSGAAFGNRGIRRGRCPPFQKKTPQGDCEFFLGDQPGPDFRGNGVVGEAVQGGFNVPAEVPQVVGNITRNDGSTGPILRCRGGMVLATDNLCYSKGIKGLAAFRKWKPGPRAFLPPKDIKCLRRSIAIRKSKTNKAMFRELGLG